MSETDYYKILGLNKDCNESQIKKAYKKLAMQWHPDKHTTESEANKKEADAKFKKISEAYQVLSDPEKKKKYDMFGTNAFNDNNFQNFHNANDMFNMFFDSNNVFINGMMNNNMRHQQPQPMKFGFGGMPHMQHMRRPKDEPKNLDLFVTLEELFTGTTKNIVLKRKIYNMRGDYECMNETVLIEVKPGYKEGVKIKFANKCNEYYGREPGDVIFTIKELPHKTFIREKDDLTTQIDINYKEALNGFNRSIKNLNGDNLVFDLPGIKTSSYIYKIEGEGFPIRKDGNIIGRGDVLIKFNVHFN